MDCLAAGLVSSPRESAAFCTVDYFFEEEEDGPLEKKVSMFTIFFKKPHYAFDSVCEALTAYWSRAVY